MGRRGPASEHEDAREQRSPNWRDEAHALILARPAVALARPRRTLPPVFPHRPSTRARLAHLGERLRARIHPERVATELHIAQAPGRITHAEARELDYRPAALGMALGPLFATHWLRVAGTVPAGWAGSRVDLLLRTGGEATLWIGRRLEQGLNTGGRQPRPDATVVSRAVGGERVEVELELASNDVFGYGESGGGLRQRFALDACELARFDADAWRLYHDFEVLRALELEPDVDPAWAGELLAGLDDFCNSGDTTILAALLERRSHEGHEVSAIGHAHLDTAWLWPLEETERKALRTFSTQLRLLDEYPEHLFAVSQAQQLASVKRRDRGMWERLAAHERFLGVGGCWVEPDTNLPAGESLARQFLYGQRFFERELGRRCTELWLPDTFGYSGQLPQLMRLAGMTRMMTQKLSWNAFNPPEHHTFTWEGIDGSAVLVHFPPADTYNAEAEVAEVRRSVRAFRDHERSRDSLLVFGYGDGGGGPTRAMLERLRRIRDLRGMPRVELRSPEAFFERVESGARDLRRVEGELYFEYHRGTYTTQAQIKRGNRLAEGALHDAECLAALAARLAGAPYPREELRGLWETLLTCQFHDILPGTSIAEVNERARQDLASVQSAARQLTRSGLAALGTSGDITPVSTGPFDRVEIAAPEVPDASGVSAPEVPDASGVSAPGVTGASGASAPGVTAATGVSAPGVAAATGVSGPALAAWSVPAYGVGRPADVAAVEVERGADGSVALRNEHLRAVIAPDGTIASLGHRATGREALAAPGNRLELYRDEPVQWDAWDIDPSHLETRADCPPADGVADVRAHELRAEVGFERVVGERSSLRQTIRLDAGAKRLEVHTVAGWHEDERLLKVCFPLAVRAPRATYETAFGVAERPTHRSSARDLAQFEVAGHRWADLSEHGFGVALLSDCKYGYSALGNELRMSLLRAPRQPDPGADRGRHEFAYALYPHAGGWQVGTVVAEGFAFNRPLLWGAVEPGQWIAVDGGLVLDTVKLAEDSDALVLRLYEPFGGRGTARIRPAFEVGSVHKATLLEEPLEPADLDAIPFRPFEIVTLLIE
jgi:alpha-mannosidase